MAQPEEFDSVTENVECSALIDCFAQATEHDIDRMLRAMILAEERPSLVLSGLQPRDHVGAE